jgi:hypothetical protein
MAEQQPDDPRADVGARRFGKQEQAARLEHAVELGQRFALPRKVVKGLVAEDQVDAVIRQRERREVTALQLDRQAFGFERGALQARRARSRSPTMRCGAKVSCSGPERLALAAADVEDHRVQRPARGGLQAQQVSQRRRGSRASPTCACRGTRNRRAFSGTNRACIRS